MKRRLRYSSIKGCFLVPAQDGWLPCISSGVSDSFAEPSSTVGQRNTPDMRAGFVVRSNGRVNAVLTSNTKRALQRPAASGEYWEHGRSIPVSGLSRSSSGHGVPRLASLNERQIVIVSPESGLPAFSSALTIPQHHSLAGGHEACRPLSFKQNNHVSLPHERTLSRFTFQR